MKTCIFLEYFNDNILMVLSEVQDTELYMQFKILYMHIFIWIFP